MSNVIDDFIHIRHVKEFIEELKEELVMSTRELPCTDGVREILEINDVLNIIDKIFGDKLHD